MPSVHQTGAPVLADAQAGDVPEPTLYLRLRTNAGRIAVLGIVVLVAAGAALSLHRTGHTQGDDFALYLRQARSIFDGDVGAVVADNRFAVLYSDNSFSPVAYPWGWPLVLAPFVHQWGLDYDRLKILEVALMCTWLVLIHGVVRRRLGRLIATGVALVFATAPMYLKHTDELLSEFPHLAAVGLVLWWYDRVRTRSPLHRASTRDLAVLGGLLTVAFNMRREGIVLVGVVAVAQLVGLLGDVRPVVGIGARLRTLVNTVVHRWRRFVLPHAVFAVTAVAAQIVLPTELFADNGNSREFIRERFGDYPGVLAKQIGLGRHPLVGVIVLAIALVGVIVGVRRRPSLDGPIAALGLFSALTIGTHFRLVERYWFQVTPWVIYFAAVAVTEFGVVVFRHRRRVRPALAALALLYLVVVHAAVLPGDIADARDFNDAGRVQIGPDDPRVTPIYDAVRTMTPPDAVIAFFRSRTMTLLTDRRSIQTYSAEKVLQLADYFAQRRASTYWQPDLTMSQARTMHLQLIWSDDRWILWKVTE